ncbi:hypothetical protein GWC95_02270 [Sediminibacterium roseum]|uniref:DUF4390 domain-containing protein n=1 Tax=Sediminibacterium roseum TaxID=1978412 RepID=A0ABW9ZP89_9BACT|nr:hypothetical protein [Sediminibacterium roseum]NCI48729.1 hypothetical protein [Sediminibacterium roseum]
MKISHVIILLFFSFPIYGQRPSQLRCIKGTAVFPYLTFNGEVKGEETSTIHIYELGKKRLYDLEYDERVIEKNELKSTKTVRHWITFHVDSAYGYDYNLSSKIRKRVNLDSSLRQEWVYANSFYRGLNSNISVLISSKRSSMNKTLIEEYLIKNKVDSSDMMKQTFFYSSVKLKNVSASLSKELDSIKQMKLYKAQTIILPRTIPGKNTSFPAFRTEFEFQEIAPLNKVDVLYHLHKLGGS